MQITLSNITIGSKILDSPDKSGIYPTSTAYVELNITSKHACVMLDRGDECLFTGNDRFSNITPAPTTSSNRRA